MAKTTKVEYPKTTSSSFSINGAPLVQTSIKGNNISSNYNFSQEQQELNSYVQNSLLTNLSNINTFLPETIQNLNSQVEAYKNSGIETINETYIPMIKDLQNDIASRFGNLDNSIFLDNLNGLENSRSKSINALAQDVEAKRNDLVNEELVNQYNYLNFLIDYQDQTFQNILKAIDLNASNLSVNNDYLSKRYDNSFKSSGDYSALKDVLATLATTATMGA